MKKIKIAQIGVGHDHSDIFTSFLRLSDIFEVKGFCVCEGDEEHYEVVKDQYFTGAPRITLEEILNDPDLDAVSVECTENNLTKYARMALENGLHVHMDKPGSCNHAEFESMMNLAKEKNLVVHLGYMYRYNPAVEYARDIVKSGKLGKIYCVETHMNGLHPVEKKHWLEDLPGGMMFFLGCHLIDLILQFQGLPQQVIPFNSQTGFDQVKANDYGMALFKYPNGISFAKSCDTEPGGFSRRQIVICGENGTLEIRPVEKYIVPAPNEKNIYSGIREVYRDRAEELGWNYDGEYKEFEPFNRYDNMSTSFGAMVRGEKENPWSYEYEIQLHRILLEACNIDI